MIEKAPIISTVIHGSFRKHLDLIRESINRFQEIGVEVLAPKISKPLGEIDGFTHFENDISSNRVEVELDYLSKVKLLGPSDFSYYINPEGVLGRSASYELAFDQLHNVRTLFSNPLKDLPVHIPGNSVWSVENLLEYIRVHHAVPKASIEAHQQVVHQTMERLFLSDSILAVGGIIVDDSNPREDGKEKKILLVQTDKWNGKYSLVGGRMQRGETTASALERQIKEQTGLDNQVGKHIITFDKLPDSNYFIQGVQRVFSDYIVKITSYPKEVTLDDRAQGYIWIPPENALNELDMEPNARKTIACYKNMS